MNIQKEGMFDRPPITKNPGSKIPSGTSGEIVTRINWDLIIIVAVSGIIIGYGIRLYFDSKEKERRYSNIEASNRDISIVDKH
jgi:hypothetical protein